MKEKSFGDALTKLREETGYSITALAEAANISRPYLSQLESGTRKPAPKTLKKLAEALGNATYHGLLDLAGFHDLAEHEKLKSAYEDFATKEQFLELLDRIQVLEQAKDIKVFLEMDFKDITVEPINPLYNCYELTKDDRQRALNVLKELFPEYQDKKEG
jgi:transcriptional regulator with XRE-family HTH domain